MRRMRCLANPDLSFASDNTRFYHGWNEPCVENHVTQTYLGAYRRSKYIWVCLPAFAARARGRRGHRYCPLPGASALLLSPMLPRATGAAGLEFTRCPELHGLRYIELAASKATAGQAFRPKAQMGCTPW